MDAEQLRRFAALLDMKEEAEDKLSQIKASIAEIEGTCIDSMIDEGIDRITLAGRTLFIKREVWAKYKDKEIGRAALPIVLKSIGMSDIIKENVNMKTMTSIVREYDARNEPLPPELAEIIEANPTFRLQGKKV